MKVLTNHGDERMDSRTDTAVEAILDQLIETGSTDIASAVAREHDEHAGARTARQEGGRPSP